MYRGTIFGRTVRMSGSPLAMLVFRREFGGDFQKFVTDALEQCRGDNPQPDVVDFLQIAWTMAKTYDDDIEDYEYWLNSFPDDCFDIRLAMDCVPTILEAIGQEMMVLERPDEPDEKDEEATLPPRWQAYQLILSLKQMGFSMDEIREMSMTDVIAYTDIYYRSHKSDDNNKQVKKVREATAADIQALLH